MKKTCSNCSSSLLSINWKSNDERTILLKQLTSDAQGCNFIRPNLYRCPSCGSLKYIRETRQGVFWVNSITNENPSNLFDRIRLQDRFTFETLKGEDHPRQEQKVDNLPRQEQKVDNLTSKTTEKQTSSSSVRKSYSSQRNSTSNTGQKVATVVTGATVGAVAFPVLAGVAGIGGIIGAIGGSALGGAALGAIGAGKALSKEDNKD